MKKKPAIALILLTGSLFLDIPAALADVDSGNCLRQVQNFLETEINCVIQFQPSDEETKVFQKQFPVFTSYACAIEISIKKSEIYSKFIKQNAVNLPPLVVPCAVTGAGGERAIFTATFQPECARPSVAQAWECKPNVSNIQGIGHFGIFLEKFINKDSLISQSMRSALEQVERRPTQP